MPTMPNPQQQATVSQPSQSRRRIVWLNALFLTVFPVIAVAATVAYGLTVGIGWREVSAAVVTWWITGLGITAGYHRLFSHCGYRAPAPLRFVYAVLGAAACQNSAIAWCSDHRYHHSDTDTGGDPYDATRGFWYSHMGWIFFEGPRGMDYTNVPDLRRDPVLAWQHRNYLAIAVVTNLVLMGLAGLILGHMLGMFIVAVLLRIVAVQHLTFLINSAAHIWGTQPWSNSTTSRDNWFLSLFTLGEGYHNYHHSFQADYRNGPRWYNCDPTKWLIWSLSRVGLATDLQRAPVEVVLSTRFEESSRSLAERLEAWGGHTTEEWSCARGRRPCATSCWRRRPRPSCGCRSSRPCGPRSATASAAHRTHARPSCGAPSNASSRTCDAPSARLSAQPSSPCAAGSASRRITAPTCSLPARRPESALRADDCRASQRFGRVPVAFHIHEQRLAVAVRIRSPG